MTLTATTTKEQVAEQVISRLSEVSQYAADDAKLWTNHGKCRIYFERKYVEFFGEGEAVHCVVNSNPYSVQWLIEEYCPTRHH